MSEFNKYARKIDEIVREVLGEYAVAAEAMKKANDAMSVYPAMGGAMTPQRARAQANQLEVKEQLQQVRRKMNGEALSKIKAVQKECEAAIMDAYAADPAQIDAATLELLKSGILTAGEYERLYKKAESEGKHTLQRLIGKYADNAAEEFAKKYGTGSTEAQTLRIIANEAKQPPMKDRLDALETFAGIYERAAADPQALGSVARWENFTADIIENF